MKMNEVALNSLCKECQYKYRASKQRDIENNKYVHISKLCEGCQKRFSQS